MPPEDEQRDLGRQFFMESIIVTHAAKRRRCRGTTRSARALSTRGRSSRASNASRSSDSSSPTGSCVAHEWRGAETSARQPRQPGWDERNKGPNKKTAVRHRQWQGRVFQLPQHSPLFIPVRGQGWNDGHK